MDAHRFFFLTVSIGASIVGRLASWLGTITISLQGVLGMIYIGEILANANLIPFSRCQVSEINFIQKYFQYLQFTCFNCA